MYPYQITGLASNGYHDPSIFSGEYQSTDAPEYAQDSLHGYTTDVNLAQGGGKKLYTDRRYEFVQSCSTVQRLMKIYLLRNRQQGSGTLQMNLSAYQTQACDVIQMSFPQLGWLNKNLEVTNFRFVPKIEYNENEGKEVPTLSCELDVCESDPSVYTWSPAEERGVENTNSPMIADQFQVGAPSNLTLQSGSNTAVVGVDGIVTPRILATWTEPDDPFVTTGGQIRVQLQPIVNGAPGAWQDVAPVSGSTTNCYITGVVCGQQYNVQIYSVRGNGAYSDLEFAGPHVVSETTSDITRSLGTIPATGSIQGNNGSALLYSTTIKGGTVARKKRCE